jgi:hypothetical protein
MWLSNSDAVTASDMQKTMQAEMGSEVAFLSVKMMGGREEGIYASSMLADIGIQQTDHGLTLSPKIQSKDVFFFDDTCVLGDDGFEDALMQVQSISRELNDEEQVPSASPRYQANQVDDFQPVKRRKVSSYGPGELMSQNVASDTLDGAQPVRALDLEWQEQADLFMQQPPKACFPGHLKSLVTDQQNFSEKEKVPLNDREQSLAHEGHGTDDAIVHQKHTSTGTQSSCRLEENNKHRRSSASPPTEERQLQGHDCEPTTPGLVDGEPGPVKETDVSQSCLISLNVERPEIGSCPSDSAGSVSDSSGTRILDPNVPLPSIERPYQETIGTDNLNDKVDFKRIKYMSRAKAASFGLASGLFRAPRRTAIHAATMPPSDAPSDTSAERDLDDQSWKSSQTPQQPPTGTCFSDTSQETPTLVHTSDSTLVHQIPVQLRRQFDALVKKFHSDQKFRRSVQSYMMEQNSESALLMCLTSLVTNNLSPRCFGSKSRCDRSNTK